jgi:hypothetical protein
MDPSTILSLDNFIDILLYLDPLELFQVRAICRNWLSATNQAIERTKIFTCSKKYKCCLITKFPNITSINGNLYEVLMLVNHRLETIDINLDYWTFSDMQGDGSDQSVRDRPFMGNAGIGAFLGHLMSQLIPYISLGTLKSIRLTVKIPPQSEFLKRPGILKYLEQMIKNPNRAKLGDSPEYNSLQSIRWDRDDNILYLNSYPSCHVLNEHKFNKIIIFGLNIDLYSGAKFMGYHTDELDIFLVGISPRRKVIITRYLTGPYRNITIYTQLDKKDNLVIIGIHDAPLITFDPNHPQYIQTIHLDPRTSKVVSSNDESIKVTVKYQNSK